MKGSVLISGASIAGPALAHWLSRAGFEVTIVEKAAAPRAGGYPVDLRGTGVDVVRRMGLLPTLQDRHIDLRRFSFLDPDDTQVAVVGPEDDADREHHLEVRRGDLVDAVVAGVRDRVEIRFEDWIETLEESADGIDVVLHSGLRRRFDLVIGADGVHSRTRALRFGPEDQFHRYLGYVFAIYTIPNLAGADGHRLEREIKMWSAPGETVAAYAVGDEDVHVFLNLHRPGLTSEQRRDAEAQRAVVTDAFTTPRWRSSNPVAGFVQAMTEADDLFLDTATQIRMPRWSRGRVALVGDAAYAPSFLTGQGTSLAMVGAYVLAQALATSPDHRTAFDAYERGLRGFVTANQALADGPTLFPATAEALERRNAVLRTLETMPPATDQPAYSALRLADL